MNGKMSPGWQPAASGYAPLAAAWVASAPGSSGYVSATAAGVAWVAPFTVGWPLRSFLELGPFPGAVPCARLHVRQMLWEWGVAASGESTELVVSELVTNAVQASREIGAAVRMWLVCDGKQVVVFVWDASPQPPSRADPSEDDESGRGLLLVEAVSERWGHFGFDGGGKVVWAVIPATSIPGIDRSP
jgi:hypothetical protein